MKQIQDLLASKKNKFENPDKNVSQEFQIYGYDLAKRLNDLKNKSLYIKLAKEKPRDVLESAYRFAIDYHQAKSKARIFMFRLNQITKGEVSNFTKSQDSQTKSDRPQDKKFKTQN